MSRELILCQDYYPPDERTWVEFKRLKQRLYPEFSGAVANMRERHRLGEKLNIKGYWTLDEFLNDEIPAEGEAVKESLKKVIVALAQRSGDSDKPFLQSIGSRGAYGESNNLDYLSVTTALNQFSTEDGLQPNGNFHDACKKQMINFCRNTVHDVDLDFALPDMNADQFASFWEETTGHSEFHGDHIEEGTPVFMDWKTFVMEPKKGIRVFIVRVGNLQTQDLGASHKLNQGGFSLDFCSSPLVYPLSLSRIDARGGKLVAAPEKFRRSFYNVGGEIRILVENQFHQPFHPVKRYGTLLFDSDLPPVAIYGQPSLVVEKVTRLLRLKTLKPGMWDVGEELAETCDRLLCPKYWLDISPDVWSEEIFPNLLTSIHLSPFETAVNLIPNHLLDALPEKTKERIADHTIDYSLSLGNLWEVFRNITPVQAAELLSLLPDNREWDPTQNNGIQVFMDALSRVGLLQKNESFNNALLDAYNLFSHPFDEEMKLLKVLDKLSKRIDQPENETVVTNQADLEMMKEVLKITISTRPSWLDQLFIENIAKILDASFKSDEDKLEWILSLYDIQIPSEKQTEVPDEIFMRICLSLADYARLQGEEPFGAVITKNGKIISIGYNEINKYEDKKKHAEKSAIEKAQIKLQDPSLKGCILYSTATPCMDICIPEIKICSGINEVKCGVETDMTDLRALTESDVQENCTSSRSIIVGIEGDTIYRYYTEIIGYNEPFIKKPLGLRRFNL